MAKLIVHATDFSPGAGAAFRRALAAAKRDRARLLLVHVLEPTTFGDADYMARQLQFRDAARASIGWWRRRRARASRPAACCSTVAPSGRSSGWPGRDGLH
jgi:nucleotide-binding universal stress UspA family protein